MARIAVLIDDAFEDSEYSRPAEAFRQAGHDLIHLGLTKGATVKGKKSGTAVTIDAPIEGAGVDPYHALFIPGGYSPDRLRAHDEAVDFVRRFVRSKRPVFLICHASQLLITADVLRGRTTSTARWRRTGTCSPAGSRETSRPSWRRRCSG
jgi:protease I